MNHEPHVPAPRGSSLHIRPDTPLSAVMAAEDFEPFGALVLPSSARITQDMTIADTARLLPFHSNVRPAEIVGTLEGMLAAVREGTLTFHPVYSEGQIAEDPGKAAVGLFFFRGGAHAPFAIISPGGAFAYVGAVHEGFPHALTLAARGKHAFVLHYRTGGGGRPAVEDLAAAIDHIFTNADVLDVDVRGYSLWGSSAGARMAAILGSHGTAAFGRADRPRPDAVVMAYTGHTDLGGVTPPTFAVVGQDDGIAPPWLMRERIDRLRRAGVPAEIRTYPGIGHGFGAGTGTAAEGWIDEALAFWDAHRL